MRDPSVGDEALGETQRRPTDPRVFVLQAAANDLGRQRINSIQGPHRVQASQGAVMRGCHRAEPFQGIRSAVLDQQSLRGVAIPSVIAIA